MKTKEDERASNNGVVLDYESMSSPFVTVRMHVEDDGSPSLSSELTVRIEIVDVNEPPVVLASQTRKVKENSKQNTFIGRPIFGTDLDKEDELTYTIDTSKTSALTASIFDIDANTGQLIVQHSSSTVVLNYEERDTNTLSVIVQDKKGLKSYTTVRIEIEDVNEPPVVIPGALAIDVSAAAGAYVGQAAMTNDPDFDQDVTCTIYPPSDPSLIATTTDLLQMNEHDATVRIADGKCI